MVTPRRRPTARADVRFRRRKRSLEARERGRARRQGPRRPLGHTGAQRRGEPQTGAC